MLFFNGAKLCYNPLERFYYVVGYHYNCEDIKQLGFKTVIREIERMKPKGIKYICTKESNERLKA